MDLHAITVPQDPKQLQAGVINAAATYLAAGIDPEKSKVFVQVQYMSRRLHCLVYPLQRSSSTKKNCDGEDAHRLSTPTTMWVFGMQGYFGAKGVSLIT